ncbi:MAG: hypothetical protein Q4D96_05715 [Propionibacteriaceae bacterium]|nr:hypothetical protein [Propionibacteriaceae bacterium]
MEHTRVAGSHRGARTGVILALGATGMLRPAVAQLLDEGEQVVAVSRRASRSVAGLPGGVVAVDADWTRPQEYAELCREAVAGRDVQGVILWVHQPYRDAVTQAIEPLLFEGTRVVRLWGSATGDPRAKARESYRPCRGDLCDVYLGSAGGSWLTHEQISQGALVALRGGGRECTVGDLGRLSTC